MLFFISTDVELLTLFMFFFITALKIKCLPRLYRIFVLFSKGVAGARRASRIDFLVLPFSASRGQCSFARSIISQVHNVVMRAKSVARDDAK